jgi:hypothetical protein
MRAIQRLTLPGVLAAALLLTMGAAAPGSQAAIAPEVVAAVEEQVSASTMRGDLSFLASDLLEGRGTPSPGLEIAAEYIAAQFRGAGLEPAAGDSFFQVATMVQRVPHTEGFSLVLTSPASGAVQVAADGVSVRTRDGLDLRNLPVFKVDGFDGAAFQKLTEQDVKGRVVLVRMPDFSQLSRDEARKARGAMSVLRQRLEKSEPALLLALDASGAMVEMGRSPALSFPGEAPRMPGYPAVTAKSDELSRAFDSLPAGVTEAKVTLRTPAPREENVQLRNVAGLLRGSSPDLADTYVIVSAHYDHVGTGAPQNGDHIYNGANDNASGTVTMIEMARALAKLSVKPKRSILFLAYFGEEVGLFGSRYYVRNPLFPLEKTVANINLEQMGRTDSNEGPQIKRFMVTGLEFSDVGATLEQAASAVGVEVFRYAQADNYFDRSDNVVFAREGIPAHTVSVALTYPDYHGAADHWDKIDFDNMAAVTRAVALGAYQLADSAEAAAWNQSNPKASRYLDAARKREAQATAGQGR